MSNMPVVKVTIPEEVYNKIEKEPKRLWDNYQVVCEVRKNNQIKFVVGAGVRDGVRYINIREFYFRKRDGEWRPSKDGITIPIAVPIEKATQIIKPFEALIDALLLAEKTVSTMELADEEHAVYLNL